jgi:transcriptional regulator with XRE-family HTH domain
MTITPEQMKDGRLLLGWSQSSLAGHSGVSATTIGHFETGKKRASVLDLTVVRRVLEGAGVEFIAEHGGRGVKLKKAK